MTLEAAVAAWTIDLNGNGLSDEYVIEQLRSFRCLREGCNLDGETATVNDLIPVKVTPFIKRHQGSAKKAYKRALTSIIRFLREHDLLAADPFRVDGRSSIRMTPDDESVAHPSRPLTPTELNALLDTASLDWSLLYRLRGFTGLRTTEAGRLLWKHIDFKNGLLRLPKDITKAKRADVVPLTTTLCKLLSVAQQFGTKPDSHVFPFIAPRKGKSSGAIRQSIHRQWMADLDLAGVVYQIDGDVRRADTKCLRYTFDSMLHKTLPREPVTVAELMRHKLSGSIGLSLRVGGEDGSGYASEADRVLRFQTAIDQLECWYETQLQQANQHARTA